MILTLLLVAQASPDPNWNCAEPLVQQEMNWCAHKEFLAADAKLNKQWKRTAAHMKQLDEAYEEATPGSTRENFASLLKAQRAWLTYRDAHCASEGNMFSGGSMEPLIISTCKTRLTELRIEQLGVLMGIDG